MRAATGSTPFRRLLTGLLASCSLAVASAPASADVVVGQVAPLTGVLATTGAQMVLGVKIAIDAANDRGGVNGQKIKHVVADDGYKVDETIKQTKQLIEQHKPAALVGFAGTNNIGELLKQGVLEKAGIALVGPYSGGESLRNPFNPWVFHIRAGYVDETAKMVDHLATLGIKRLAVFYQDDGFGKSGLAGVETAAVKFGSQIIAKGTYDRLSPDVGPAVRTIAAAKPQAVVMVSINKPTAAFVKAYREAGGEGMLINISVVDPAELVKLAGIDNMRGVGITQVVPYPYTGVSPIVKEFHDTFKKYAPKDAAVSYTVFEEFIAAKVLIEGLKRAGKDPSADRVMQALQSLGRYDVGGFTIDFSRDNRIGSRFVDIVVIGAEGRLLK